MFITAVKITIVEALVAGFNALNPPPPNRQVGIPSSNTLDLTPNSITIEYPKEQVNWPAIFVQFRPQKTHWSGLYPDTYTLPSGQLIDGSQAALMNRTGYFEGAIDLQILALTSEERDQLWDSLYNLILMNPGSIGSNAFYSSLRNNDLLGITLLQGTVQTLGDTVSPGTPWSPEELSYESSIRIQCVGDFYESKFNSLLPTLQSVVLSGTITLSGSVTA
jgi:hypothetical protein